jgi:uncharacterized OB-fold protein
MSEDAGDRLGAGGLEAGTCPNGHVTYPRHYLCPECHERVSETVDLTDRTATVVTWTRSTATPPGVREPNLLAIVEFDLPEGSVRAIGQVTDDEEVATGDEVRPVHADLLREPGAGIREPDSHEWDGYRFEPV